MCAQHATAREKATERALRASSARVPARHLVVAAVAMALLAGSLWAALKQKFAHTAMEMELKLIDRLFGTNWKPVPLSMARRRYQDGEHSWLICEWRYRPLFLGVDLEKYSPLPTKHPETIQDAINQLRTI